MKKLLSLVLISCLAISFSLLPIGVTADTGDDGTERTQFNFAGDMMALDSINGDYYWSLDYLCDYHDQPLYFGA